MCAEKYRTLQSPQDASPRYGDVIPFCQGPFRALWLLRYRHILTEAFTKPSFSWPRLPVMPRADWKFQERIKRASDLNYRMFACNEAVTSDKPRVTT